MTARPRGRAAARMTTAELLTRLRRHYIRPGEQYPGGFFLTEVCHGQGGSTRADALYVGFTATSGRLLVGHEIKASRADWLRELRSPGKADGWADECHAWHVVAPAEVVQLGELPDGWGLMIPGPSATQMKVIVPAAVDRTRQPSWTASRSIMAKMDTERGATIQDAREKAKQKAEDEARVGAEERICKRVDQIIARTAGGGPAAIELLARIEKALGRPVVDHLETYERPGAKLTPDDLALLAPLIDSRAALMRAADELASPYFPGSRHIRSILDQLDEALAGLIAVGRPPTERTG